jgi:hypothetical protein
MRVIELPPSKIKSFKSKIDWWLAALIAFMGLFTIVLIAIVAEWWMGPL